MKIQDVTEINKKLDNIVAQLEENKRLLPRLTIITYKQDGEEKQEVVWRDSYGNYISVDKLHYGSIKEMRDDLNVSPALTSKICNGDKENLNVE